MLVPGSHESCLFDAVFDNDLESVRRALQSPDTDINACMPIDWSRSNDVSRNRYVYRGQKYIYKESPLSFAMKKNYREIASLILDYADRNTVNYLLTVANGEFSKVRRTLLHYAIEHQFSSTFIRTLLEKGAIPDVSAYYHHSIRKIVLRCIAFALFALSIYIPMMILMEPKDEQDKPLPLTPSQLALIASLIQVYNIFIFRMAIFLYRYIQPSRKSPKELAIEQGLPDIVALLDNNYPLSLTQKLIQAAQTNDIDRAREAIAAGADISTSDERPIICSRNYDDYDSQSYERLIYSTMTPLSTAVFHGQLGMARLLVEAGADINQGMQCVWESKNHQQYNAIDVQHDTPLSIAIKTKNLNIAEYLLARQANVNHLFTVSHGINPTCERSALGLAISMNLPLDFIERLVLSGANLFRREIYPISRAKLNSAAALLYVLLFSIGLSITIVLSAKEAIKPSYIMVGMCSTYGIPCSLLIYFIMLRKLKNIPALNPLELASRHGYSNVANMIRSQLLTERAAESATLLPP